MLINITRVSGRMFLKTRTEKEMQLVNKNSDVVSVRDNEGKIGKTSFFNIWVWDVQCSISNSSRMFCNLKAGLFS